MARLTLVTLDCGPIDIMKSVAEDVDAVYPSRVLHLRDQPPKRGAARRVVLRECLLTFD